MKALLTLLVVSLLWGPPLYAQKAPSITLDMPNASLPEIIEKLSKVYGVIVSNSGNLDKYAHIHLSVHHASLDEVMKEAVVGLPVNYAIYPDGDTYSMVVYELPVAQRWKYAVLPRDTLKPPFS